ncbi:MAG: bifunctional DNA primase/polymerase [Myxococcales bacterium]
MRQVAGPPESARDLGGAALALAYRGARVLPLRPAGKLPLTAHGCRDATSDAAAVRAWWQRWPGANVGLATGGGLLVVDVDPRHGGAESLAGLPELPATRESLTGGGGRHLFYRGQARCSAGRLGPGLDVRGEGGYVVAPPSVHPSGAFYRWHPDRGLAHPCADAPRWLLDRLAERPRAAVARPPLTVPQELDRRVRRARAYLGRLPSAVSGSGGHAATWTAALALVQGFALPADVALALLAEDFNPRCLPPWSERELRHKVESAVCDARLESGYLLAEVRP